MKVRVLLLLWILVLVGCQQVSATPTQAPLTSPTLRAATATSTLVLISALDSKATEETPTVVPTNTPPPSPTIQPSDTPIPEGFGIVPDVRGMPSSAARTVVLEAGFTFLFQDVLDPEVPSSTIVDQDPPAGIALPLDKIIFLFRSFQALQMYAGGECQPLRLTLPAGKLLYWVELDEGVSYNVRTDFAQGRTQVSDYRMYLFAEFENAKQDSIDFTPLAPGRYVISLGPYEVSKSELEREGSIKAGCLWITPEDLNS